MSIALAMHGRGLIGIVDEHELAELLDLGRMVCVDSSPDTVALLRSWYEKQDAKIAEITGGQEEPPPSGPSALAA